MQTSDFRTRLTSVYGSQTSSVVLSTPNSVLSTRIKRQYGFQPSPVVMFMQTATLALEKLVSIVPRSHLWFLHAKQRPLDPNSKSLWVPVVAVLWLQCSAISTRTTCPYGSQPLSAVLRAKERLLEQNYKSVWDPDHTCRFVHARQRD